MYKVLVFGGLPIASKVCQIIQNSCQLQLIGVVIEGTPTNNDPFPDTPILEEYAEKNNIKIYTLSDLNRNFLPGDLDLGISARFPKILHKEHLNIFNIGIINFHGGLLPEYGGLYSANHALLNADSKAGGTIHWIDEGIDTGKLIQRFEFDIEPYDTAFDIFQKTQISLLKGFKETLPKLINSNFEYTDNKDIKRTIPGYYNKDSLKGKKKVDLDKLKKGDINELNRVRAFDFPGHEPAYTIVDGIKIYLKFSK